ncbi:sce7726 family protein [Pedobacter sp. UBA4863]|mgnify:CR=1 FL=1|uniref:sce7726 family protein n=1 Tax=Pedobacter sp. UBA4863 TaxID=1947060 RepID=UPI0025F493EF|nr:sce7726 family protein [Pedobacter sp. UBA4863]
MYSNHQLRDYSTLFTRSEMMKLLANDFNSIDAKLERYASSRRFKGNTYLKFFKHAYKVLSKHYPNEYIYKNQFLNNWLKNELGTNDSVIFSELRLGKAIADLAMFNGISKVFEIKTILDTAYRLNSQLNVYQKVFNEIYIVVPFSQLERYIGIDEQVGIIAYDDNLFHLERAATTNYNVDAHALMEMLHTKEYKQLVLDYYGNLPEMNAFTQFDQCKELISQIPAAALNGLFMQVMKQRKTKQQFLKKAHIEFNQICLSLNLSTKQLDCLVANLNTQIT